MANRVLNGRYELKVKIGEGGMAVTWKGQDLLLGREVAIKIMRESLGADEEFISRFHQEAQAAASLTHEHIAAIYDFGNDNGTHYIVMEYVPGEDLRRLLKHRRTLSANEALELVIQIAEALEAAHTKGIVHRDIKPANILLNPEGSVKVADFGIARALSGGDDTSTGTLLGSVHYISPEQARDDAVGPQADIYSLGIVLFEMLTGRPPFQASTPVAVVHKHIYDPPPSPQSLNPSVPTEMEGILLRCLAKDLSGRYANARELLSYLRALRTRLNAAESKNSAAQITGKPFSDPAKPHYHRGAGKSVWQWIGIIAGIMAICGLAAIVWFRSSSVTQIAVPLVVGMDLPSARATLAGYRLQLLEVERVHSSQVSVGRVATQQPRPGEMVAKNSTVEVQVSLGTENVMVPNVSEMSEQQARRMLEESSLRVGGVREEFSNTIANDMVITSEPPSGAELRKDTTVVLVVSKGVEPPVSVIQPLLPATPSNTNTSETITYTVPKSFKDQGKVEVIVEVSDENSRRILYRGQLSTGESIPPIKTPAQRPITIRIIADKQVTEEKTLE